MTCSSFAELYISYNLGVKSDYVQKSTTVNSCRHALIIPLKISNSYNVEMFLLLSLLAFWSSATTSVHAIRDTAKYFRHAIFMHSDFRGITEFHFNLCGNFSEGATQLVVIIAYAIDIVLDPTVTYYKK